ncbi:hypothetical protein ACEWY4_024000 [Coilia grayii]|uniref:Fibronectin type-III domain-containing protein n=1 Tax=Coilia grayii TaxID=363190 RepID=A0ABD1IZ54_9TELE
MRLQQINYSPSPPAPACQSGFGGSVSEEGVSRNHAKQEPSRRGKGASPARGSQDQLPDEASRLRLCTRLRLCSRPPAQSVHWSVCPLRAHQSLFLENPPPPPPKFKSEPSCPPGSYKMSSRQQECFPCPAHSMAEEEGSVVCLCEDDHFRTPLDSPSAPCTRPPSPPRNLVYTLKQATVILEWAPPSDTGGRGDLTYSVGCRRCVRVTYASSAAGASSAASSSSSAALSGGGGGADTQCEPCGPSVGFVPQQSGLTERTVTVVNLLPNANYTFTVEALNGVSELLPNKRFYTQVNVSTSLAGKTT